MSNNAFGRAAANHMLNIRAANVFTDDEGMLGTDQVCPFPPGAYDIGFWNDGIWDETQLNIEEGETVADLEALWIDFCKENNFDPESVDYIQEGVDFL